MTVFAAVRLEDFNKVLVKDYLDHRTGFLNDKMVDLVPPFADVSVNLPLLRGRGNSRSY